jgi:hypothetical protein
MRTHFVARCVLIATVAGGALAGRAYAGGDGSELAYRFQHSAPSPAFPAAPLFVADPLMNKVFVYDSTATGTVTPNSIWGPNPANKLDLPVAVAAGLDCIEPGPCRRYAWVLNKGHGGSVTVYRIPFTGPPTLVHRFKVASTCPNAMLHALGIAHAKARVYITSTSANRIADFPANSNGLVCPTRQIFGSSTTLASPVGPSVSFPTNANSNFEFEANLNAGTVTGFPQQANGNVGPALIWNTGGAIAAGTATDWNLRELWLTTDANAPFPTDALWMCPGLPLPSICPTAPTITGSLTGLALPGLPSTSKALGTVFVPNQAAGTVTEYFETSSGNVPPIGTFTGLAKPYGTAVENTPD